ncbi:glutathione S-transferase [Rhizobium lusitanum]|uniref:Glutathione S-transferase n=2 Tax=Rhizobium lusitanum TaxID=293958 RepID=A0A6L9UHK1_9HYPH|nr:glutathione S-transferase [Rhizobium lusitanum]
MSLARPYKLFISSTSPFARKVLVVADVLGLSDQIKRIDAAPHPIERDINVVPHNPLGKVPTLLTAEGGALFDSRVITEYLDSRSQRTKVYPAAGERRWRALALQALGDGLLDAALLARYEQTARPEDRRWTRWYDRQFDKIVSALDAVERQTSGPTQEAEIGEITFACALGYLDLRFPDFHWRSTQPRLAAWFEKFSKHASFARAASLAVKAT